VRRARRAGSTGLASPRSGSDQLYRHAHRGHSRDQGSWCGQRAHRGEFGQCCVWPCWFSTRGHRALWPVNHGDDLICLPHQGGAQFQLTSVCCGKWHARAASAWRVLGPGFVTGSSEDDPSGIQTVGPNSLPDTTLHPLALVAAAIFGFLVDFIKVPTFDRLGVV